MSAADDVPDVKRHSVDDATAESVLRGTVPSDRPELEPLAVLLSQVRDLAETAPKPTPALSALLRDGFEPARAVATASRPTPARSSLRRRLTAVAGLSLTVKVLTGTGVAIAGVATAAGTGVLPDAVQDRVSTVVSTLTPFDLGSRSDAPSAPERQTPDRPQVQLPPAVDEAPRAEPTLPAQAPRDEQTRTAPEQERTEPGQPRSRSERATERPAPAPAPQERPRGGATPPRDGTPPTQQAPADERPANDEKPENAAGEGTDGEVDERQASAASRSNTGASRSR